MVRFNMASRTAFVVVMSALLANSADAQCAHQPPILATVTVEGCVAASFGATDVTFAPGPEFAPRGTDVWLMYQAGDKRSGTLITFLVTTSKFVWPGADHWANGARLWRKGEVRSVFVQGTPADTCPRALPAPLKVQTQPECFDMFHNILPVTIPLATVISDNSGK
jgi:hypothetical protein